MKLLVLRDKKEVYIDINKLNKNDKLVGLTKNKLKPKLINIVGLYTEKK